MTITLALAANPILTSLGLALVNFVWQGAIIGLVTAAVLHLLTNARPQVRYAVSCTALALSLGLPVQAIFSHSTDQVATNVITDALIDIHTGSLGNANFSLFWSFIQIHSVQVVVVWAACVALFSVRLALGLAWVAQIANPRRSVANPHWQEKLNLLTQRAGLTRLVNLRVVNDLESPAVAGWLRPFILVPGALLTGMPADLLEALLAHEVAHIQRMDYLVNLLQSTVEILLFYHPSVWWISKQIRIEREQIADDLAAQLIGEPRRLALALSQLERVKFADSRLSVAANGGNLINRIRRLTAPTTQQVNYKVFVSVVSALCAGFALYANAATDTTPVTQETTVKAVVDFRSCAKPDYPKLSLANKDEGTVRMSFLIGVNGHINRSVVDHSSGHPDLDEAAINALNKCTFTPATQNGRAVTAKTHVDYVWQLPN